MRWLLAITVAALAVPSYAGENDAEKLFRAMEEKVRSTKALRFVVETVLTVDCLSLNQATNVRILLPEPWGA